MGHLALRGPAGLDRGGPAVGVEDMARDEARRGAGGGAEHPGLMPTLREAAKAMAWGLDHARSIGLDARVPGLSGVPPCLQPGYERSHGPGLRLYQLGPRAPGHREQY